MVPWFIFIETFSFDVWLGFEYAIKIYDAIKIY